MTDANMITLNSGVRIPQRGFGVFQVPPTDTQRVVEQAIEIGYRHIDTAAAYNNEAGVGAAVRASGLPRAELFVTTKLRNGEHGYESALRAYDETLRRLGLDHVDLYLVHWPNPSVDCYVESWHALERLYADGGVRAIGVSNFLPEHLDRLAGESDVTPAVNQIELHPSFQQRELTKQCRDRSIAVEAYSPLGQGVDLQHPAVRTIAGRYRVTPAQVVLRWHLQLGHIVIPKSVDPERIRSNFDLDGFRMTDAEVASISALDAGRRVGGDPRTFALSQIR
ncbi:MAG: aldo/keto reductase [Microlunatus sp.]|nr:aldo/keto reductase [Microlunatus sp.]